MLNWILWILIICVIVLVAIIYYLFKRAPKIKLTPHETYLEALKALLNNDRTTAFLRLKETVMSDTGNVDAYLRLTALLRQKGNAKKALQIDSDLQLRQNLSHYERGEVLVSLAEDYLGLSQYDAAEKILHQLKDFPDRKALSASRLVKLFAYKKDWHKAFEYQMEYLKLQDNEDKSSLAEFKVKRGDELLDEGKYHEARVEYKDALKYNPLLAEAVIAIGDSYEKQDKPAEAVKAWKRIIEVDASKAEMVFDRIQKLLFELGQYSEIEEFYHLVLEKDAKNLQAILGLASLAEKRGEQPLAEDFYNQALDINSEYLPALLGLIRFYQRQQRTEEAAKIINRTAQAFLRF